MAIAKNNRKRAANNIGEKKKTTYDIHHRQRIVPQPSPTARLVSLALFLGGLFCSSPFSAFVALHQPQPLADRTRPATLIGRRREGQTREEEKKKRRRTRKMGESVKKHGLEFTSFATALRVSHMSSISIVRVRVRRQRGFSSRFPLCRLLADVERGCGAGTLQGCTPSTRRLRWHRSSGGDDDRGVKRGRNKKGHQ